MPSARRGDLNTPLFLPHKAVVVKRLCGRKNNEDGFYMKCVLKFVVVQAIVGLAGVIQAVEVHRWWGDAGNESGSGTLVPKSLPGEVSRSGAVMYNHQGATKLTSSKWETDACWYSVEVKKNQRVEISFSGLTDADAPFNVHVLSSPFDLSTYYAEYNKLAGIAKWTTTGYNGFNFRISAGEASGGSRTYTLSNGFTFKSTQDSVYICVTTPGGLNEKHTIGFTITAKFEETEEGAPTCVEALDGSSDNVRISWAEVTGATSYNLYRSTAPNRPKSAIRTKVISPFFDRTAEPGVKYYYWVEAIHSSGSAFSLCDTGYRTASLSLSPATRSHAASSCHGSFTVTANAAWSATANKEWIKLETNSGNGNGSLTYTIDENSSTSSRTGFITVVAGSDCPMIKTISILQDGAESTLSYSIEYDLNGGSYGLKHPTKVASDAVVQVSAPTRNGYVFAGWTVTKGLAKAATWGTSAIGAASPSAAKRITDSSTICYNGEAGSVWFVHLAVGLGSVTLKANWVAGTGVVIHRVMFDLGSHGVRTGGGMLEQMVVNGSSATAPSVAANYGYEFVGWDNQFSVVLSDLTVTAKYSPTAYSGITHDVWFVIGAQGMRTGGGLEVQTVADGASAIAPFVTAVEGYEFKGWSQTFSSVRSNLIVAAEYSLTKYTISYELNGGTNAAKNPKTYTIEDAITLLAPTRNGYTFKGWTPNGGKIAKGSTGDKTFMAQWEKMSDRPTMHEESGLYDEGGVDDGEDVPYASAAAVYDGCLYDGNGAIKGTIQVRVAKGKVNKKSGAFEAKVTATVQLADGSKKLSFKGGLADEAGAVTRMTANGKTLDIMLGESGLGGELRAAGDVGPYQIDGARNFSTGKSAEDKQLAKAIDNQYANTCYNIVGDDGVLSIAIAKKGKAKITGTWKGVKVSATSQLLVGEDADCVPVVVAKKVSLAFNLWITDDGQVSVAGIDGAKAGLAGTLKPNAKFTMEPSVLKENLSGLYTDYLPDGLGVAANGSKWVVADGAKAGKVVLNKAKDGVDAAKLLDNPSALKLTYKQKDGSFKGSFKAYNMEKGKPKAYTVNVTGVLINGVGYGTAVLKKPVCSFPITIE